MRIPLNITFSEQIICLESFKKTFDLALSMGFLNSSNEAVVVAFGKQGKTLAVSSMPSKSDYILTFFRSSDLQPNYVYTFTGYADFINHQMDIKASG
jgi:hypothetical protein